MLTADWLIENERLTGRGSPEPRVHCVLLVGDGEGSQELVGRVRQWESTPGFGVHSGGWRGVLGAREA